MKPLTVILCSLSAISMYAGQAAAQAESTKNFLQKQCNESTLVLRIDPGPFREAVGTDFSLVLEEGKAIVLIIVQDCSQYWLDGLDLGPTQHNHVWALIEGPQDIRPVVGAQETGPTRTWFSLFAGSTNPRDREARKASGTSPEPIEGVQLHPSGSPSGGQVTVGPGLSYSWSGSPSVQPPRPTGVNHDVYLRDSAGNIVLKRIQAIANHTTEPTQGRLEVVGGVEPRRLIRAGTYPVQVRFFPVWARVTLGETPTGHR